MQKLIIWVTLLLGSATTPLLAQLGDVNYSFDSRLDAHAFRNEYPDFLQTASFEVQLSKGNRLLLMSRKYSGTRLVQRPDSLVRQFWNEYGRFIEQMPDNTEGTSVHYILEENREPQLRWRRYPQPASEFSVLTNSSC